MTAGIESLEQLANGQEPEVPSTGSFVAEPVQIEETADGSKIRLTMSKEAFIALTAALTAPQGAFRLMGLDPDDD
ncbi:hypothetical protein ACK1X7_07430 [Streptomyces sp. CY1]|uniref:hypothetical protein n=1 Tax=Streptomyces sp. CY1 TaxID=3388313 RepID=UPI0039A03160